MGDGESHTVEFAVIAECLPSAGSGQSMGCVSVRETYRDTLTYALAIAGSEAQLAVRLNVPVPKVVNWLMGVDQVPADVFLKAVDIVLNATAEEVAASRELLNKLKSASRELKRKT
jgi:hypothetical protein